MKTQGKLTEKGATLLVGTETLDIYLKEIGWNLRTMVSQTDVLETAMIEMKKQMREYSGVKSGACPSRQSDLDW